MAKWHRIKAQRQRRDLIEKMGGRCVASDCPVPGGETEFEKLTFDHIHGKSWVARGKSADQRITRYLKEYAEGESWCESCQRYHGKLQVLCQHCNSKKGDPVEPEEEERFAMLCAEHGVGLAVAGSEEPF